MKLSHQNAMRIVTEISEIIGQHVNMMDHAGIIIASTDETRIGTFHEGAYTVIAERMDMLVIDHDDQLEGSRKGINLPLILHDTWVGVIGMTGEYKEVMKYGQIIKKMTEAMMLENDQHEQKKIDDRIMTRFLDEWVLDGAPLMPEMIERGARLNIDVRKRYGVIVAVIADLHRYSDSAKGQMLIDRINRTIRRKMEAIAGGIFAKTATKMICLIPNAEAQHGGLETIANSIVKEAQDAFGVQLHAGIASVSNSAHQGYQQASKAVQACASGSQSVYHYDNIGLEIFMEDISQASRTAFIRRIFRGYSDKELASAVELLRVYYEANASLQEAARRLYLHKNTLQYKLNKMRERTGYDPRNIADSALIYLAIAFYLREQS